MNFPSRLIENAVNEFEKLPGIGRKTALRLVLHLLKQSPADVQQFSDSISRFRTEIKFCTTCGNLSDASVCPICSNRARNHAMVCVVESVRDVMAIEAIGQYNGVYHVLGGIISPMEGVGPEELNITSLI